MTVRWTQVTEQDAAAWAGLCARAEEVDKTGENYDAEDLAEELADPLVSLEHGTLAGWDGDVLVAVGVLRNRATANPVNRVYFDGVVDPAYRRQGLGRRLTEWAIETTPAVSRSRFPDAPMELHASVHEHNTVKAGLLTESGFAPQRWFFTMQRPLDGELPEPVWPDGVRVEGFDHARHDLAALRVRNESFADHWGSSPQDEESWRQWYTGTRAFVPELSYVALAGSGDGAGDEMVAFLLTQFFEADQVVTGRREAWISTIGTLRAHRRRGLASALIATCLRAAAAQGYDRAALGVDADNPTGALGVYEAAGFTVDRRHVTYVREFPLR
ncbi:GNAT family N-acetyltransferase [Hamadaea sp. NPDC050747]|uniref:GNAT family N-acetyltransferase n=1 Tax=Hamadaea sp. NPDC050747 TaxID=3155789 RepID=UPI0034002EF3